MDPEQEKHWKLSFSDNVEDLLNREPGQIAQHCTVKDGYSGEGAAFIKQFGRGKASKREGRDGDTPTGTTPRDRVWIYPGASEWGELIDDIDTLAEMADPTSDLTSSAVEVIQDAVDLDYILPAFFGVVKTGKSGEKSVSFSTTKHRVNVQFDGEGGAVDVGMSRAKLKRGLRLMKETHVKIKKEKPVLLLNAQGEEELYNDIEKQGLDDMGTHSLVSRAFVNERYGVTIEPCEDIEVDGTSGHYRYPLFVKSGIHVGFWFRGKVRGGERSDKRFNYQLYAWAQLGATRTQPGKVIEIPGIKD